MVRYTELDEEPSCLIENCMQVTDEDTMFPFPRFTAQRDMFLTSENDSDYTGSSTQTAGDIQERMSSFYTNIQLAGDTILYRGYEER